MKIKGFWASVPLCFYKTAKLYEISVFAHFNDTWEAENELKFLPKTCTQIFGEHFSKARPIERNGSYMALFTLRGFDR